MSHPAIVREGQEADVASKVNHQFDMFNIVLITCFRRYTYPGPPICCSVAKQIRVYDILACRASRNISSWHLIACASVGSSLNLALEFSKWDVSQVVFSVTSSTSPTFFRIMLHLRDALGIANLLPLQRAMEGQTQMCSISVVPYLALQV